MNRFTFNRGYKHVEGGDTASIYVLDARWFDIPMQPGPHDLEHHHEVVEVRFMDDTTKRITMCRVLNECHRTAKQPVASPRMTVFDTLLGLPR